MSKANKIYDFTITLYSNKSKVVKEVVAKPTELEKMIDLLDQEASIPRRGDGHHGYYIEVEIRRTKDVQTTSISKRHTKPAARKVATVHSGRRRSKDDSQSGSRSRRAGTGIRSRGDGVSTSKRNSDQSPDQRRKRQGDLGEVEKQIART